MGRGHGGEGTRWGGDTVGHGEDMGHGGDIHGGDIARRSFYLSFAIKAKRD